MSSSDNIRVGITQRWNALKNSSFAPWLASKPKDGGPAISNGWSGLGLQSKLLVLTAVFVMLAEVLIFLPSIANFRVNWLTARLTSARLAALAADAAEHRRIPPMVKKELFTIAKVKGVAIKKNNIRRLVLPPNELLIVHASYDFREKPNEGVFHWFSNRVRLIGDAFMVFMHSEDRIIRVYGRPESGLGTTSTPEEFVEIVLPEAPLRDAMIQHAGNILILSIIISIIAASLIYFALNRVLVRPMMHLYSNMIEFSANPEDASRTIEPSQRHDEVGIAQRELANMQREFTGLLQQKSRLAQLGLAVSKINHDLRNMLASAQLISDRLADLPDPTVQRFAPKLISSLDRAISFCNDTLKFGKVKEAPPRRQLFALRPLVDEVADGLDLPREAVGWHVEMPDTLQIDADREHMYRILNNICRNSAQALEAQPSLSSPAITLAARRDGLKTIIDISDNGPGVPAMAKEKLFQAFQGSARKGGTGLGLAISAELVQVHGGQLQLLDTDTGAAFQLEIPDRAA